MDARQLAPVVGLVYTPTMDKYTIHFHTERDGILSFHFHANDAL